MPSVCDTVQDALVISEALAFGIGQNVPSDNLLLISDTVKMGVAVHSVDALTIHDAVVEMWTQQVRDTLTIGDHTADHLVAHSLVSDSLRIRDAVRSAISDKVVEAMTISDRVKLGVAMNVVEAMTVADVASIRTAVVVRALDALSIRDTYQHSIVDAVADHLIVGDSFALGLAQLALDALTVGDAYADHLSAVQLVRDALTIGDAAVQRLVALVLAQDHLLIEDHSSAGAPAAWSAHVEPFAMSRYTGFGFQSMADVNGVLLLAGEGGIYAYTGTTDAGRAMPAFVEHDLSDAVVDEKRGGVTTDENLKRPRYLYASYHGGQIALELGYMDDNDAANGYVERRTTETMPAMNSTNFRTGRVPLSRGVRSRYLRPILKNVSGGAFSMNNASLQVDSIKRKA